MWGAFNRFTEVYHRFRRRILDSGGGCTIYSEWGGGHETLAPALTVSAKVSKSSFLVTYFRNFSGLLHIVSSRLHVFAVLR